MDRIWQWAWDRHGARYSWATFAAWTLTFLPVYALVGFLVVWFEGAAIDAPIVAVAIGCGTAAAYGNFLPGWSRWSAIEGWARHDGTTPREALAATYTYTRAVFRRSSLNLTFTGAVSAAISGALAGASTSRMVQYAGVGGAGMLAVSLIGAHTVPQAVMRPVREAIAGESGVGDDLPRARPTFATWSNVTVLATAWAFTLVGVLFGVVVDRASDDPYVALVIATGMLIFFAVPITVGAAFGPGMRPLADLAEGTERVARGDYTQRLPVAKDDDLGVLVASFNRMQDGLAQRERLQAAFGSYVDPALASRLLDQGDDVFSGERREVTVMFVDIRDFTPFAEANSAEDTVGHLNALFEIVVPAVLDGGGHVNKYLGDGALAVFGAPNTLARHADAAIAAARTIQERVQERFDGTTRIGIGINTGQVIAGTIGGGGKLEFTLIGDTVNVAARVEALTKSTGDTILLTEQTLSALSAPPDGLVDRGAHELKGKAAATRIHALESAPATMG